MTTAGSIQLCKDIATMETGRCSGFLIKTGETCSDSISWKNYWGGFQLSFLCVWKWKPSTTFSGNDGFFDLTHVGTGERLNVQESWANKHPRNDGCVVAYLGEHKLSDLLWIIHIKEKLSKSCISEKPINDSLYNLDCDKTNSMHKWDRFVYFQEVGIWLPWCFEVIELGEKITISWILDAAKPVNTESGTLYRWMKSFLTKCEQDKWRNFINLQIFLLDPGLLVQLVLCQTQERRQSSLSSKASVKGLRL